MRLSIADDLWATHPDVEWNAPRDLPPIDEIRDAELHFRQQLQPVSRETAARVLQALVACFQAKWEGSEAKAQLDVWLIVLGDVPGDLWTEGATLLMRNHTFGMPKPSHLLAIVKLQLEQRKINAERVRRLLEKAGQKPEPKPVERETPEVRLRAAVWRGWHSRENEPSFLTPVLWRSACQSERELARIEEREPAAWSVEGTPAAPPPKLAVPLGWTRPPHFAPVLRADEVSERAAIEGHCYPEEPPPLDDDPFARDAP